MKKTFLLLIIFFYSGLSYAKDDYQAVLTKINDVRYEIVQSEIARKLTIMVDKVDGYVYQLVSTSNDWYTWQMITKEYSREDTKIPEKNNYQVFMGGISLKDCFLLNVHKGITWILVEDSEGSLKFSLFE